jgi:hypothetical protein
MRSAKRDNRELIYPHPRPPPTRETFSHYTGG